MQHNLLDGDTYRQEVITIVFDDYWFGEFTGIHSDNLKRILKNGNNNIQNVSIYLWIG